MKILGSINWILSSWMQEDGVKSDESNVKAINIKFKWDLFCSFVCSFYFDVALLILLCNVQVLKCASAHAETICIRFIYIIFSHAHTCILRWIWHVFRKFLFLAFRANAVVKLFRTFFFLHLFGTLKWIYWVFCKMQHLL